MLLERLRCLEPFSQSTITPAETHFPLGLHRIMFGSCVVHSVLAGAVEGTWWEPLVRVEY